MPSRKMNRAPTRLAWWFRVWLELHAHKHPDFPKRHRPRYFQNDVERLTRFYLAGILDAKLKKRFYDWLGSAGNVD